MTGIKLGASEQDPGKTPGWAGSYYTTQQKIKTWQWVLYSEQQEGTSPLLGIHSLQPSAFFQQEKSVILLKTQEEGCVWWGGRREKGQRSIYPSCRRLGLNYLFLLPEGKCRQSVEQGLKPELLPGCMHAYTLQSWLVSSSLKHHCLHIHRF